MYDKDMFVHIANTKEQFSNPSPHLFIITFTYVCEGTQRTYVFEKVAQERY